jgi:hypothetical protein
MEIPKTLIVVCTCGRMLLWKQLGCTHFVEVEPCVCKLSETNRDLHAQISQANSRATELEALLEEVLRDYEAYQTDGDGIRRAIHDPALLTKAWDFLNVADVHE